MRNIFFNLIFFNVKYIDETYDNIAWWIYLVLNLVVNCAGVSVAANDENMMYVVGATQGRAFEDIRKIVPNHFLLVPGVGAQGGSLEEVCKYGMNSTCGLIVNSSRAIIYADKTENFAVVAGQEAQKVQAQMAEQLKAIL